MNSDQKGDRLLRLASVFARQSEMQELRKGLLSRRSFLLRGPAGIGKTMLLSVLIAELPNLLYSPQNSTPQMLYRNLADSLDF